MKLESRALNKLEEFIVDCLYRYAVKTKLYLEIKSVDTLWTSHPEGGSAFSRDMQDTPRGKATVYLGEDFPVLSPSLSTDSFPRNSIPTSMPVRLTPKEFCILDIMYGQSEGIPNPRWESPTTIGRLYGLKVLRIKKARAGYSSHSLIRLFHMGLLERSDIGRYRIIPEALNKLDKSKYPL